MKEAVKQSTKLLTQPKKLRVVRVKDNKTITVYGYNNAAQLTGVPVERLKYNLNRDDKVANGYKFYDY